MNTVTSKAITIAVAFAMFGVQCGCADVRVRWSSSHVLDGGCAQGLERSAQLDAVRDATLHQERQAILAARPKAESIVAELWQRSNDWKTVATQVREDESLSDPVRRVALNMERRAQLEAAGNAMTRQERRPILAARPEPEAIVVERSQQSND